MRVFVTGGAGYIGTHTIVELLAKGHEVSVLDNLCNSHSEALNRVKKIAGRDISFVEADVRDKENLIREFERFRPDVIIHLAGLKAVEESIRNPIDYYDNNVAGSLSLLQAMDDVGCLNIVFSSSATVYGDPQHLPYEETHPTQPINPYGRTKLMVEEILRDWVSVRPERSAVALRYFNPVGAHPSGDIGEHPSGLPSNLMPYISQVAVGRRDKLYVFGGDYETSDGTGERDYIHVVDLAKAHVAATDYVVGSNGFETFNIGTGQKISVLELVKKFEKASGRSVPYQIVDRRPGDLPNSWADPKRAREKLGWSAERNYEDMCRDTWTWQVKNPNGYS